MGFLKVFRIYSQRHSLVNAIGENNSVKGLVEKGGTDWHIPDKSKEARDYP